jgi:putative endonuclease
MRTYFVYVLANHSRSLYIGVTNDLARRLFQHRAELADSYTARVRITRLVYFECTNNITAAIEREKELKRWHRPRKLRLIDRHNRGWRVLGVDWNAESRPDLEHDGPGEA